jgi:hypothetical protein
MVFLRYQLNVMCSDNWNVNFFQIDIHFKREILKPKFIRINGRKEVYSLINEVYVFPFFL